MDPQVPAAPGVSISTHATIVARSARPRRLLFALGISLAVLTIEVAGGILTGSLALLSDATHVGVDVIALLVGLGAARLAAREPDDAHTYGFHRLEAIGALANAVLLLVAASAVFVESVGRLVAPAPTSIDALAVLAVACVGLVANSASALIVHGGGRRTGATRVLVLHLGGDAVGALAVSVAALVMIAGGPTSADAVASLAIAVLLALAGVRLLGQIVHLLAEGVPTSVPVGSASAVLHAVPGVAAVHDLHVWALAEDMPVVTAHLELAAGTDTGRALLIASEALRGIGVDHATLQLEGESCGQGRAAALGPRDFVVSPGEARTAGAGPS